MSTQQRIQAKAPSPAAPAFTPAHSGLLQRKCACGGSPGLDGECEECRNKRLSLQRRAGQGTEPAAVPPIVHEVLRSPGQPLDAGTRTFMEPRFGHDFSQVRVHTDARAAESAQAVNALAYTVGRDVVFGVGQYAPGTNVGKRLLAHELTHTIQQRTAGGPTAMRISLPGEPSEREANKAASLVLAEQGPMMQPGTIPLQVQRQELTLPPPSLPAPSNRQAGALEELTAQPSLFPPGSAPLSWSHSLRYPHDALWYFCGEHPIGFSTDAVLEASTFPRLALLTWRIREGADKVAFQGQNVGTEVVIRSLKGSQRPNDVAIEVSDSVGPNARSFIGRLTVRKPDRLIQRGLPHDQQTCPPWGGCAAGSPVYWTEIGYRVVDNVGGTIVGATVNENFPGAKIDDQPNNWEGPAVFATVPFWRNTNGTFVDNWFHWGGMPAPVALNAPNANQSVDRMQHEFFVGSITPGKGCRVQRHTAHRYLGFARHENIVTPAP